MLEVENLSVSYGKRKILHDINFSLSGGQSVCLLGKNGVGKTTLFRSLLNTLSYSGKVLIDENDSQKLSRNQLAQLLSYIPQNKGNTVDYSVFEMILMGTTPQLKAHRQPGEKERAQAQAAIDLLKINYLKESLFSELSGGEQQLVIIARSVAQQAKIILMDEPCANLDFGNQVLVLEMIRYLAAQGYLIFQSTHDPNHALQYADRVLIMEKGRLTAAGYPQKILTGQRLTTLYNTPIEVVELSIDGEKRFVCLAKKGTNHVGNL
ncbi:ABC transporter ATP-binding protein [Vagococcus elongatus]|uniref:ABC transporter domain-containing protein n=1 Tax=Vagococcus elongatus TaxID=180344 RepID=A0A430AMH0_9ENTE|nr:ABC transporter ATP-binding protein [Vagococcus elongatus]RSU09350.1 hypothetical protein CBF29_11640 [Vagococcus elongatus]